MARDNEPKQHGDADSVKRNAGEAKVSNLIHSTVMGKSSPHPVCALRTTVYVRGCRGPPIGLADDDSIFALRGANCIAWLYRLVHDRKRLKVTPPCKCRRMTARGSFISSVLPVERSSPEVLVSCSSSTTASGRAQVSHRSPSPLYAARRRESLIESQHKHLAKVAVRETSAEQTLREAPAHHTLDAAEWRRQIVSDSRLDLLDVISTRVQSPRFCSS